MDKTYVLNDGGGSNPNDLLFAAMNGGMGGNMWNNPIWAIVFLAALRNGGIFGDGNGSQAQLSQIQDTLNTNQGNALLMDAIKGNSEAIGQLAQTIGCNQNAVIAAINAVQGAISQVGNQVGLTGMQVINAVQSGNCNVINALQSCCCDIKTLVTNLNYEGRIANQEQTAFIGGKIDQQTTLINDKFCQLEMREMQRTIDALREEKATLKGYIDNAQQTAQISAMIAPLKTDIDAIKCRMPQTVNVPYSPVVGVPSCVAYQNGFFGLNGFPFTGSNGGFL